MRIDSHVHVGDWNYFQTNQYYPRSARETVMGLVNRNYAGAVLMPSECKPNQELLNEIREIAPLFPIRLYFFPWIRPADDSGLHFVTSHKNEISGIKIHPSLDRTPVTDMGYGPALDMAEASGFPVIVHCGRWQEVAGFERVIEIAEQRPNLILIMAHMGGDSYELKLRATQSIKAADLRNIYLDTAGTHESWLFEACIKLLGADRFLMGSDWPIREPLLYSTLVENCSLSLPEKQNIQGNNILRLIKQP